MGLARDADEAVDAEGDGGQNDEEDDDDDGDDVVSLHFGRFVFWGVLSGFRGFVLFEYWCWVDSVSLWCLLWAWKLGLPPAEVVMLLLLLLLFV